MERIVQTSSQARWAPSIAAGIAVFGLVLMLAAPPSPGVAGEATTTLRVIANGQPLPLVTRAIIQGDVVMAQYQGLFDPLGIRATWNPSQHLLHLTSPAGDEMELRAGDPYATVNGENRPIPIPLVEVFGRVLIPVQWVFETLGDVTAYDPATHTLVISPQITGVSWRGTDAGLEVAVEGTGPLHATLSREPAHLIVDVSGAAPKSPEEAFEVNEGNLAGIHITRAAAGARIVLDLMGPVQYRLLTQAEDRRVLIALTTGSALPAPPPGPSSAYHPSSQKITDIAYEHLDGGGGRVVITANRALQVNERKLRNPDRVVIDVLDAVFLPVKKSLSIDDGLVVQVRAAQFHSNPNVVRIVIELARPSPDQVHPGSDEGSLMVDIGAATAVNPPPLPSGIPARHGPIVVAVDAGHGGSDPGAIGPTGVKEKDVVLAIAQDLRRLLTQQHVDVVMVRETDVFVPLEDRGQIAARGGATMLVSIHANASTEPSKNGTQTFYATPQSQPLAAAVLDELSRKVGLAPRGETQARFKVLVDSKHIPAILVETAFVTNPREEQMLRDPAMQEEFAQGIAQGIQRYLSTPPGAIP